jgi:hypothetical protein
LTALLLAPLLAFLVTACSTPEARIEALAHRAHFEREIVRGTGFRHVIYRPEAPHSGSELHVYLEGDGTPYRLRTLISADPTPRTPLALELMMQDAAPTLYLGRPCYLGLALDPPCTPGDWTLARFSPAVVESLAAVLEHEIASGGYLRVTLIGHSGGGALAVLLANRVDAVDRVVTIAGNLDVSGWTRLHRYTPLSSSLDPLAGAPPRSSVELIHFAGGADLNITPALIRGAAARLGGAVIVIPGFDHRCCWVRLWPELLRTNFRAPSGI